MYLDYSDEKLIKLASEGDKNAGEELICRYKNLVRNRARKYFLAGGDTEDLIQEGMIGLYKAMGDFDSQKNAAFFTFAYNCISKKILTAVKAAARLKHMPLNVAVNLAELTKGERLISKVISPEEIVIEKEDIDELNGWLRQILSDFERKVLNLYIDGLSYADMSAELEKPAKTIDNALSRAKNKIKSSLLKSG